MENLSQSLPITAELLGLTDIEITAIKFSSNNEIIIEAVSTKKEIPCHKCGKQCNIHGKGQKLKLRHLPILGKKTFIEITPPRGICPHCDDGPTTTQTLPWYDRNGRYTKNYEQTVLFALINSTIADVCIREELGEHAIQNIVDKYIDNKVNWKVFKRLGIIGIDEISLKKGHQDFVTIITSRHEEQIRILAVIKGREKAEIKAFLSSIPKNKRKTVIAVCSDMYDGFVNAAKEVFGKDVLIVVDRFHVAKLYRKCLVELRKKELSRLRRTLSAEEYTTLKLAIAILVKNSEFIAEKDKIELDKLFKHSPLLKVAYKFCRKLTHIFNSKHKKVTADIKIDEWIDLIEGSELNCFNTFISTLKKYKNEITNYFVQRHSSGYVEGFNNKIKVIKRRCYGIFNIKHLFQRIFLDTVGYNIFDINQGLTACAMPT